MNLFCKHRWKEKERHVGNKIYLNGDKFKYLVIIQECEKCGKLKKVEVP